VTHSQRETVQRRKRDGARGLETRKRVEPQDFYGPNRVLAAVLLEAMLFLAAEPNESRFEPELVARLLVTRVSSVGFPLASCKSNGPGHAARGRVLSRSTTPICTTGSAGARRHYFRGRTTFTFAESDAGLIHSGVPSVSVSISASAAPSFHCLSYGNAMSGTLHPLVVRPH